MTNIPLLIIGDGTTSVNLLPPSDGAGIYMLSWRPKSTSSIITSPDSPLPSYRDIAQYKEITSVIETMTVTIRGNSADGLIRQLRTLRQLLEQASDAFVMPSSTNVYLTVRNAGESNTRYAAVLQGEILDDGEIIGQPFIQPDGSAVMQSLSLVIRRYHWQENIPGSTPPELPISVFNPMEPYSFGYHYGPGTVGDGSDYVITYEKGSTRRQLVGSHELLMNWTHLITYDSGAASYSSNLLNPSQDWTSGTVSIQVWPTTPEVGDIIYFGCATGGSGGPEDNFLPPMLIWEMDQELIASGGILTYTWEYYSSSGWQTIDSGRPVDGYIDQAGVNAVHFQRAIAAMVSPPAPATTNVNGEGGWWVRATLASFSGTTNTPTFATNFAPYCPSSNYIQVQGSDLGGDLPIPIRFQALCESETHNDVGAHQEMVLMPQYAALYYGVRSNDRSGTRGPSYANQVLFNSQFLFTDRTDHTLYWAEFYGDYVSEIASSFISYVDDFDNVSQRSIQLDLDTTTGTEIGVAYLLLDTRYYAGKYRVFVEVEQTGSAMTGHYDLFVKVLAAYSDVPDIINDSITIASKAVYGIDPFGYTLICDFGEIVIPDSNDALASGFPDTGHIFLTVSASGEYESPSSAMEPMVFRRIILLPSDEAFGVIYGYHNVPGGYMGREDNDIGVKGPNGIYFDQTIVPRAIGRNNLFAATFLNTSPTGYLNELALRKQYSHWGNMTLRPGKTQRIYFLPVHIPLSAATNPYESIGSIGHVELYGTKLYRSARGNS